MFFVQNTENIASVCQLSSNLQHSSHKESVTGNVTSFPVCYTGWHAELSPLGLVQHMDDGAEMFQTPLVCAEGGYERGDEWWWTIRLFSPSDAGPCPHSPLSRLQPAQRFGVELEEESLLGSYSTDRSWQDFDLSQNATLGLFFATTLSRKRLAFLGRLSRRVLQLVCLRRLLASLESRRRRSCRTMPLKASQTLCCMAAEVSINLQSNTAAQARPSGTESQPSVSIKRNNSLFFADN